MKSQDIHYSDQRVRKEPCSYEALLITEEYEVEMDEQVDDAGEWNEEENYYDQEPVECTQAFVIWHIVYEEE